MCTQKEFSFFSQGNRLKGTLHIPNIISPAVVIGSHGLLSTRESKKQKQIAQLCTNRNIAYFRIDHTGCGESTGRLIETTLDTRVNDIIAAASTLRSSQLVSNRLALFGSSMGGASCIASWHHLIDAGYDVKGIVTLAAPIRGQTITEAAIKSQQELNGIPLCFYTDNLQFDLTDHIKKLHHIMVIHGDSDEIVPVTNAELIFAHAKNPKEKHILPNADHRISDKKQHEYFISLASSWLTDILQQS